MVSHPHPFEVTWRMKENRFLGLLTLGLVAHNRNHKITVVSARQKFAPLSQNSADGQSQAAKVVFGDTCSDLSTLTFSVHAWLSFPRPPHGPKQLLELQLSLSKKKRKRCTAEISKGLFPGVYALQENFPLHVFTYILLTTAQSHGHFQLQKRPRNAMFSACVCDVQSFVLFFKFI